MEERRADYRVSECLEGIKVVVTLPGDEEVETRLLNLSARGAAVVISGSSSTVPSLPDGTTLQLSFTIPGLQPLAGFLGIVRHERDSGDQRVLGLEIADWQRLYGLLPSRLFAIFNRRRHLRVDLPADPPVETSVRMEGDMVRLGHLADISASGCAVLFAFGLAPPSGDEICISFQLPGTDQPFHLGGTFRGQIAVGSATRCGIEFRNSLRPGFVEQEQSITEFVMQRRGEESENEERRSGSGGA